MEQELTTIARTLRIAALWIDEEGRDVLYSVAEAVEGADAESMYLSCPVCEEVECDDHCPLAGVRSNLGATGKRAMKGGPTKLASGTTADVMIAPAEIITDPDRAEALGLTADARRMRREQADRA